ncbi:MAG: hypothetical protein NT122_09250 [Solirubrobacterales bacterium]|nr:hypothetical protein [Solirubrobacterales bacterium]
MPIVGHTIMVLAALLLLAAGWRVASRVDKFGLERAAETTVLDCAAAILEALILGQFSVGSNRWALLGAALITALIARWQFPRPEVSLSDDLRGWWCNSTPFIKAAAGAGTGALLFTLISTLVAPQIGFDAMIYHYPEVIKWVHNGRPGSNLFVNYDIPVEAYPHNGEILMTWAAGMARSFVPLTLIGVLYFPLLVAGIILVMRALAVRTTVALAATVAILVQPHLIFQTTIYTGDVASLAWATVAAGLALGSRREPRRIAFAFVAAGLALGTKTTVLAPVVIVIASCCWINRKALVGQLSWILPGALAGVSLGVVWLVRTTIQHGWPFWPIQSAPWGDPVPVVLEPLLTNRFIDAPWTTISHDPGFLIATFGGGLVLFIGALLAPMLSPQRRVFAATGLFALTIAAWSLVPGTGGVGDSGSIGSSMARYTAAASVIAAVAIALTSAASGWRSRVAIPLFAISAAASIAAALGLFGQSWATGLNGTASAGTLVSYPLWLLIAVICGGLIFWVADRSTAATVAPADESGISSPKHPVSLRSVSIGLLSLGLLTLAMSWAATGYLERWTRSASKYDIGAHSVSADNADTVTKAFLRQPRWRSGDEPIRFASRPMLASLAGERLQHDLVLLPANGSCASLRQAAYRGWAVTAHPIYWGGPRGFAPYNGWKCFNREIPAWIGEFNIYRFDLGWRS